GFGVGLRVRETGSVRVIGIVPRAIETREDIDYQDVVGSIIDSTGLSIDGVNWFSTYRISHRVADHFRIGRAFLLGDAGHIHSPAGGQGMNTGIGDAINLSWKLAAVLAGRADSSILDTYESERISFARTLVSTTDKLFQAVVQENT